MKKGKTVVRKKLSIKEIEKRHKSNIMDKDLHKVIDSDQDDSLLEKFNNILKKAFKPAKS